MNFKGVEKWKKLKEILYNINQFHKINAYSFSKNITKPIFDLSVREINANDDIIIMKNNNQFIVADEKGYVNVIPRKNKFILYYSNCVVYEEKIFHKNHLNMSEFYSTFKDFKNPIKDLEKMFEEKVDTDLMEKNFKKDLGEETYISFSEDGFYVEIENPKNNVETIKKYLEEYILLLKNKFKNINLTEYELDIKFISKV